MWRSRRVPGKSKFSTPLRLSTIFRGDAMKDVGSTRTARTCSREVVKSPPRPSPAPGGRSVRDREDVTIRRVFDADGHPGLMSPCAVCFVELASDLSGSACVINGIHLEDSQRY